VSRRRIRLRRWDDGIDIEETVVAKYLLIQNYEGGVCTEPMGTWDPADVRAHIEFQENLNDELAGVRRAGRRQGVAAPDQAKRVTSDGTAPR
jgi:hypothetical protein